MKIVARTKDLIHDGYGSDAKPAVVGNSMHGARFHAGGFVVHRIVGPYKGRVSAWFNPQGVMTDAEQILPSGVCRPVKRGGPMWRHAQSWGGAYGSVHLR